MKYILLAILLVGCKEVHLETKLKDSREDLINYKCSEEDIKLVSKEYQICSKSSYLTHYCFKQAKVSICEYKKPTN